jgi:MYXO-CTERM domain-containing protein
VSARRSAGVLLAILVFCAPSAWGLVLLPDSNGPAGTPPDDFIGRWNANASCVVVGPDLVITTRHQGGGVGSIVQIGEANYYVSNVWTDGIDANVPDLRIAELAGANFTQYASINTSVREVALGAKWSVVLGGYGVGRGSTLYFKGDPNTPFGYAWDYSNGNHVLRWGQNKLVGSTTGGVSSISGTTMFTNLLTDQFDGPGSVSALPGEAGVADYDSGGGWFHASGDGNWYLTGLSWGTDHASVAASWFDDPNAGGTNPELNYAVRISFYAGWIFSILDPNNFPTNCGLAAGNWTTAGTWTSGVPTPHTNVNITNGGTVTINQAGAVCPALRLGVSAGESGSVNMTDGTLSPTTLYVGAGGTGLFTQSGGGNYVVGSLYLGFSAGSVGSYRLSDGNLIVGGNEYIGDAGSGVFAQLGGKHVVFGTAYVGYAPDANGTYALSGGQWIVPHVSVGNDGVLALSGGVLRGSATDANVRTNVDNQGLVHVTAGTQVLGSILSPDASLLSGTVQVDAGASLTVTRIVQDDLVVSGTLVLGGDPDPVPSSLSASGTMPDLSLPTPSAGDVAPDSGLPISSQPTPEPCTLALLALGGAALLRRRRAR